jgi:hypothetical protein
VIGSKETGLQTVGGIGDAPDSVLIPNVIKGQFSFTETKNDLIFFSASFKLPANYKPDSAHPFSFGIGNIISSTMLDSKGKGTTPGSPAVIKSLKVLIRGIPKGGATKGGEMATVSATLSRSGLVAAGFDTEGITNRSTDAFPGGPSVPRKIQTVLLLDGVPYRALVPVDLTISSHGDFGVISGRAQK